MKKTLLLWLFGLLLTTQVFAQNRMLSGTVKDATTGEALIGVNVTGKGTTMGTVTDIDGKFTLELPKDVTALVFSYIGYTNLEKPILSLNIDAAMSAEGKQLEEVVVTSFAVKRESRSTSFATQTVKNEDFNKTGGNVFDALQGKVAGVKINATSGQVGTSNRVVIRGESSITGNNNALLVVDGIPINNKFRGDDNFVSNYTDFGNNGNAVNPDDIESMTVLKDAAAAAIYGAAAANGVIIITTKQGRKNTQMKVTYGGSYGWDKVWQIQDVTNREQYQALNNESRVNAGKPLFPANDPDNAGYVDDINTDWQKEGLKTGMRQNHNVAFSGGGVNNTYNVSLDYFQNKGTYVGNGPDYTRYTARVNNTLEKGIFKLGQSLSYSH